MHALKHNSSNKLGNPDKVDKFLQRHKLPKLTQKQIENLNGSITSKEIDLVIKQCPTK